MSNREIRRSSRSVLGAGLLLFVLAACGAPADSTAPQRDTATSSPPSQPSQPSSPPAPPPPASPLWSGAWAGTTSEGLPISFTVVDDDWVNDLSVSIKLTGDCGIAQVTLTVAGRAGGLVDQLLFVGDTASAISLRGVFTDSSHASGTATANYLGKFANGTTCHSTGSASWSAKKQ